MTRLPLDQTTRRRCKRIAHHLAPIVLLGDKGVSAAVIAETDRALNDHELIKVRLAGDREQRAALIDQLADACAAAVIQRIGRVGVLYRANPEADPRLSNLARFSG
jgi:RNA-binding protein